jgi:hypothetical protein
MKMTLPAETAKRKAIPLATGVLDYFPAALAAVAALSKAGNDKHNPGEALHWARGKSMDQADCIVRHLIDRGTVDPEDGIRHSVKVAWRALAMLQIELEEQEGAPLSRGSRLPEPPASEAPRCPHGFVRWRQHRERYECADCGEPVDYAASVEACL